MNKVLHVYSSEWWHNHAFVIGDREALLELRKAIDEALESSEKAHVSTGQSVAAVRVNDGEGYNCFVVCVPEQQIDTLAVPYMDATAAETDESKIWPCDLVAPDVLRKLSEEAWLPEEQEKKSPRN